MSVNFGLLAVGTVPSPFTNIALCVYTGPHKASSEETLSGSNAGAGKRMEIIKYNTTE